MMGGSNPTKKTVGENCTKSLTTLPSGSCVSGFKMISLKGTGGLRRLDIHWRKTLRASRRVEGQAARASADMVYHQHGETACHHPDGENHGCLRSSTK